jgi:hypothetical protein
VEASDDLGQERSRIDDPGGRASSRGLVVDLRPPHSYFLDRIQIRREESAGLT